MEMEVIEQPLTNYEIVEGLRKSSRLYKHGSFLYYRNKDYKNKTNLRCEFHKDKGCNAKAYINKDTDIFHLETNHNHEANLDRLTIRAIKKELKDRAEIAVLDSPREVYENVVKGYPERLVAQISYKEAERGMRKRMAASPIKPEKRKIEVCGSAEVAIPPDTSILTVVLTSKKEKASDARVNVERILEYIKQTLRKSGITEEHVMVYENLHRIEKDNLYCMETQVDATFNSALQKCMKMSSLFVEKFDSNVKVLLPVLRHDPRNVEVLRKKVCNMALKNARQKATDLCKDLNQSLGRVITVSENVVREQRGDWEFNFNEVREGMFDEQTPKVVRIDFGADEPIDIQRRMKDNTVYLRVDVKASFELRPPKLNYKTPKLCIDQGPSVLAIEPATVTGGGEKGPVNRLVDISSRMVTNNNNDDDEEEVQTITLRPPSQSPSSSSVTPAAAVVPETASSSTPELSTPVSSAEAAAAAKATVVTDKLHMQLQGETNTL